MNKLILNVMTAVVFLLMMMVTLLIVSCGAGNGDGLDASGQPIAEEQAITSSVVQPNLKSIQQQVFGVICIECHVGAAAPEGLRLDSEDNSFDLLVNVRSNQDGNFNRVEPGDPDNSYLIQKLEGTALINTRMPLGKPALSEQTISAIRQWISDGSLRE